MRNAPIFTRWAVILLLPCRAPSHARRRPSFSMGDDAAASLPLRLKFVTTRARRKVITTFKYKSEGAGRRGPAENYTQIQRTIQRSISIIHYFERAFRNCTTTSFGGRLIKLSRAIGQKFNIDSKEKMLSIRRECSLPIGMRRERATRLKRYRPEALIELNRYTRDSIASFRSYALRSFKRVQSVLSYI